MSYLDPYEYPRNEYEPKTKLGRFFWWLCKVALFLLAGAAAIGAVNRL